MLSPEIARVRTIDEALTQVADLAPLPQDLDPAASYYLLASHLSLTTNGLRATLVTERLSDWQRRGTSRGRLAGNDQHEAFIRGYTYAEDGSGLTIVENEVVSDDIGTSGNVVRGEHSLRITMPRKEREASGERFVIPFAHSDVLSALINSRNERLRQRRTT